MNEKFANALLNVLVIEDNVMLAEITTRSLKRFGLVPRLARCGEEAMSILEDWQPDLILLDLNLPDMDGWDVLNYAESRYGEKGIRVIVTTAYDDDVNRLEGRLHFVGRYLVKPVDRESLYHAIEQVMEAPTASA